MRAALDNLVDICHMWRQTVTVVQKLISIQDYTVNPSLFALYDKRAFIDKVWLDHCMRTYETNLDLATRNME
jgi:hypothetical protein